MMNPVPWLQMTNMISYQGLVRTFLSNLPDLAMKLRALLKTGHFLSFECVFTSAFAGILPEVVWFFRFV
ncbi:hypothetical protein R9N75_07425, partial [Escherichia coli]